MKKLLKNEVCGIHKQYIGVLFTEKVNVNSLKKKKKDAFTACNYIVGPMPKTQTLKCSKCRNQMGLVHNLFFHYKKRVGPHPFI